MSEAQVSVGPPRGARILGGLILALVLASLGYVGVGAIQLWRAPARPGPGQLAPPLVGTTLDGEPFDLAALRGRVVLLDFWATWCRGCITWLPIAQRLHHELGPSGLVVVGLSVEHDDEASVRRTVAERGLVHPQLIIDPDVQARFGMFQLPTYWLIDREGRVAGVWRGAFDEALARARIEAALRSGPPELRSVP